MFIIKLQSMEQVNYHQQETNNNAQETIIDTAYQLTSQASKENQKPPQEVVNLLCELNKQTQAIPITSTCQEILEKIEQIQNIEQITTIEQEIEKKLTDIKTTESENVTKLVIEIIKLTIDTIRLVIIIRKQPIDTTTKNKKTELYEKIEEKQIEIETQIVNELYPYMQTN